MGSGGGGESGKIAALGQPAPRGIEVVGPATNPSLPEASYLFHMRPGLPSSEVIANTPPSFGGPGAVTQPSKFGSFVQQARKYQDLLQPLMQNLQGGGGGGGGGGQGQPMLQQQPVEQPTFEPGQVPYLEDDPLAFLKAFHIQS